MTPHDEMDLTAYLQTEGRRLARLAEPGLRPAPSAPAQQQAGLPQDEGLPQSLTQALRRLRAEQRLLR